MTQADQASPDVREVLEAWCFNLMLEQSGNDGPILMAIGGAVLDLCDLVPMLDELSALRAKGPGHEQ